MTTYQGGKKRIGRRVFECIKKLDIQLGTTDWPYFEPFAGMCSVISRFAPEHERGLLACDANESIIRMWQEFQNNTWIPPVKCSRDEFVCLKNNSHVSSDKGFVGAVCSWGGVWFHGYRLDYNLNKDFIGEGIKGLNRIKPLIKHIEFVGARSYKCFNPSRMLIYCDPPYEDNVFDNVYFKKFNHAEFWDTMREWSKNNLVIISNSRAPSDFIQIWTIDSSVQVSKTRHKKYKDNLYVHTSIHCRLNTV